MPPQWKWQVNVWMSFGCYVHRQQQCCLEHWRRSKFNIGKIPRRACGNNVQKNGKFFLSGDWEQVSEIRWYKSQWIQVWWKNGFWWNSIRYSKQSIFDHRRKQNRNDIFTLQPTHETTKWLMNVMMAFGACRLLMISVNASRRNKSRRNKSKNDNQFMSEWPKRSRLYACH